ncbi:hypothetical protein ID866_8555 [Astraeus odoratus]|nr:hypothetical protein ID866_8555 [Astraeus odoratus]
MHSISDLTTFSRKTTGDVPPKLVGASTTVVGSKVYLFLSLRRAYLHAGNNQLIIFGGMGNAPNSTNNEDLCVLNDIRFFDLSSMHWLPPSTNGVPRDSGTEALVPKPRYAHLSSVTADRLFIIGGQDLSNVWLDDIYVYDLLGKVWIQRRNFPHHCGTYRSVAVSANLRVRLPQDELRASDDTNAILGSPGSRFRSDKSSPSIDTTPADSLIHVPYSTAPTDDFPNDIYLYSNYNFTDVKRELQIFSPLPDTDFTITDRSSSMTGTSFPPGLRFPSGAILGTHFIIAGTYLAHTYQSYSIWALDLVTMTWSRMDPGNALAAGSWFRACLWAEANKFVIFGNRDGNLVEDYNRRLLSWDHVAVIDLESFGIYQPPPILLDIPMQELGLSALEEGVLADFEIICDDGRKIKCSRKLLEDRWQWFKDQRIKFVERARQAIEILPSSSMDVGLPDLPGAHESSEARPDPRLTPRAFNLSEPYPVTLALLQYFYSLSLITPLQHAPAVLSQLLILSSTYQIAHLEALVKHAMHRALSNSTSVGVYEVATLCSCRSLQIRALKTVMAYSQKRTGRSRADSRGGGSGHRNPDQGDNEPQSRGSDDALGSPSRTRGASDVRFSGTVDQQNMASNTRSHGINQTDLADVTSCQSSEQLAMLSYSPAKSAGHKASPSQSTLTTLTPARRRRTMSSRQIRALSIVSVHTDFELCAFAELLSPSVADANFPGDDFDGVALDDGCDDYLDAHINSIIHASGNTTSQSHLLLEHEEPLSPSFDAQFPSALSSQSESENEPSSDDMFSLPYSSSYFNFPRRVRSRARSCTGVSASDSDTPSLSSSASFSSRSGTTYSQPHSPAILKTPIDHPSLTQPTIIEERSGQERVRTLSQSSGSIMFAPIDVASDSEKPVRMPRAIDPRPAKSRNVEHLRLNVLPPTHFSTLSQLPSLNREFEAPPPSSRATPTPSTRTVKPLLSRVVTPTSKSRKSSQSGESATLSPTLSAATTKSSKKEEAKEAKSRKAEAKRMKKAEEKARMERLAEELKERQRRKMLARDRRSVHSNKSGKQRQWDKDIAMYEGLAVL